MHSIVTVFVTENLFSILTQIWPSLKWLKYFKNNLQKEQQRTQQNFNRKKQTPIQSGYCYWTDSMLSFTVIQIKINLRFVQQNIHKKKKTNGK